MPPQRQYVLVTSRGQGHVLVEAVDDAVDAGELLVEEVGDPRGPAAQQLHGEAVAAVGDDHDPEVGVDLVELPGLADHRHGEGRAGTEAD